VFEIVRAIHEALGTDSTLVFVLVVILVFGTLSGGAAYLVHRGYKNSRSTEKLAFERHLTPGQIVGLTDMAANFPKTAFLYVRIPTSDLEAQAYGKEIWGAVSDKVQGSLVYGSGPIIPSQGLQVASGSFSEKNSGYVGSTLIASTFMRLGIPFDYLSQLSLNGAPIGFKETYILVGSNPRPNSN
jgi:hypothetical protein